MGALAGLAEAVSTDTVITISTSKWLFGGLALTVLLLLGFLVTRINIDR